MPTAEPSASQRVTWPYVLRVVSGLETRERILSHVRGAGFAPESWGTRSSLAALADSLSQAEDWLEMQRPTERRQGERETIRAIRRRLEIQLWN